MVKYAIAALLLTTSLAVEAARGQNNETVLLDFTSPHCGPCRQMAPIVDGHIAAGYPIKKIDVTVDTATAQRYGVTQIPCFIMLVNGREASRRVGAMSGQELQAMFPPVGRERGQSPDPRGGTEMPAGTVPTAAQVPAADRYASSGFPSNDPWGPAGANGPSGVANGGMNAPLGGRPSAEPDGARAPAHQPMPQETSAPTPQDAQLISSSVRLKVDDAKGHSYGTGTIIDTRSGEALVITCGHLFRDSKGQGPVTVELFEATPQGVRVVDRVQGHIVSYNVDREIGLISIKPTSPVRVAPIAPTQTVMGRGDRVTSVGCNNGQDPTALGTRVTATNRYQGPPNLEAQGAPVEGRSGGGLFNTNGELVGVCFAADYEGNEGLYTALESIHDELDRLGLSDVYQRTATAMGPTSQPIAAQPPVVRGQEPALPVMPSGNEMAGAPAEMAVNVSPQGSTAAPAGLNQVEQAAWEEIMARSADSEVICIIRPKQPGGKSEVITLHNVSQEFVRGLAERTNAAPSTIR
jgi:thiol-disulfide isomerase/thioredoxin